VPQGLASRPCQERYCGLVDEWLTAVSRQGHPVPRRLPASSPMLGNTGRLQHTVGSVDEWLTDAGQSGQPPG
jgi:hypothetical protein